MKVMLKLSSAQCFSSRGNHKRLKMEDGADAVLSYLKLFLQPIRKMEDT